MFYLDNDLDTIVRYDPIKFFDTSDKYINTMGNFLMLNISTLPTIGTLTITQMVARPDLLSYQIFGDTQYWWLLLLYNNIDSVLDLEVGRDIKYFSLDALEQLYIKASTLAKAQ